jgi:hypothetical protein
LLPATATSLLLILPWRPAYTLLGLVGVVVAIVIAILTPRITPEPRSASAELVLSEDGEGASAERFDFRILVLLGITDSVVRSSFFVCLPFLLIGKEAAVTTAGFALTLVFVGRRRQACLQMDRQLARQRRYHRYLPGARVSGNCRDLAAAAATDADHPSIRRSCA